MKTTTEIIAMVNALAFAASSEDAPTGWWTAISIDDLRAAALRLDELEAENARLRKERDYAVKWGNASVESVQEAMWRYQDALRAVFARLDDLGNADQRVQYFLRWPEVKEARAALAGSGEK